MPGPRAGHVAFWLVAFGQAVSRGMPMRVWRVERVGLSKRPAAGAPVHGSAR